MTSCIWKSFVLLVMVTCTAGCQTGPEQGAPKYNSLQRLQQTGSRLTDALRIEPKVVKALDETSLEYDHGPIKPGLHLSAASVMEESGQLDGALDHYASVLGIEPANRKALIGVARIHHRQGKLNESIADYRRAIQILGNDPVILNDLGLCLARANRHEEAIGSLRAALAMRPDSLMYRNNLAAVLVRAQRPDDAVGVLAQSHGLAVAHYNVGYLLNQEGEPAAASAHFVRSLQANPTFGPAKTMLDQVVPQIGRRPEKSLADRPNLSSVDRQVPAQMAAVTGAASTPRTFEPARTSSAGHTVDAAPAPDNASHGIASHGIEQRDEHVKHVAYVEPAATTADELTGDETTDVVTHVPPIRLPSLTVGRRRSADPVGYVAPTPTRQ